MAVCRRRGWPAVYAGPRPNGRLFVLGVRQSGPGASLLPEIRNEIRARFAMGVPLETLARQFERSTHTIRRVLTSSEPPARREAH